MSRPEGVDPASATWEAAFASAIEAAVAEPWTDRLYDARFGRFASGGYYWHLRFMREIAPQVVSVVRSRPDTVQTRSMVIAQAWQEAIVRAVAEDEAADES